LSARFSIRSYLPFYRIKRIKKWNQSMDISKKLNII